MELTIHALQASDFGLPDDPSRPVVFALSRSFVDSLEKSTAIIREAHASISQPVDDAKIQEMMATALSYMKDAGELSRWIYKRKVLPTEEAFRRAQDFRELGDEYVADICSRLQRLPQGAPPKKREAYIDAFEFMLRSGKNSLGQAVRRFCPCGQKKHDLKCSQRFKAGIHNLKRLLRKYAPELAAQYDDLHPDRAKRPFSPHKH